MEKIIKYCLDNNKVMSFYLNKEDNLVHSTGFALHLHDDEVLIAHINPRGEYDGFILNKIDNIYKLDYDSDYEKKIQKLYNIKKQNHHMFKIQESMLYSLLEYANKEGLILSLELKNDKITGFVNNFDENYVYLTLINDNGWINGKSVISIDEVIVFVCDTDYEQDLKLLYEQNYEQSN